ncbi:MAG TPA: ATP-grasp domain-containing protein [Kofleriaceae bacterium]|nr:ATP-grasp domain-containing protein [Kofleriaceae bacterium]
MTRHYVFVESNTTGTGRLAVERLLARGQRVTFVTRQPTKYPFLAQRPAPPTLRVAEVETNDAAAVEACVRAIAAERPIDALLTFSTFYVPLVAELAARLGHRYLDPQAALTCHEKHRMRAVLSRAGLPTPGFWLVRSAEEAEWLSTGIAYPCVVKPTAESGSTGVRRVDDRDQLLAHVRTLASRTVNERGQALAGEVLVERFVSGPEFSVETLTRSRGDTVVLGVTRKHLSAPPCFVELGHDFPADLDEATRTALEDATLAALDAVGFDLGPAHTELRLSPEGPVVIEINPRLAGGMIPELVRHATGLDLLELVLAQLVGDPVDLTPTRRQHAAIRFVTSNRDGRLAAIRGVHAARASHGVCEVAIDRSIGAAVRSPSCAADRLGYIIATGEGAVAASAAERALAHIRLDVDGPIAHRAGRSTEHRFGHLIDRTIWRPTDLSLDHSLTD